MLRRNLILLLWSPWLLPAGAGAKQLAFSIHDDLLSHPQFEVIFSDAIISEPDALALLADVIPSPSPPPTYSTATHIDEAGDAPPTSHRSAGSEPWSTYELVAVSSHSRYLCAIPVIAPPSPSPDPSAESTELARAVEARELERVSARGWELLAGIENICLYFMTGWWSYSFCAGREVVQFHAQVALPNGQPPVRDLATAEYVLGVSEMGLPRPEDGAGTGDEESRGRGRGYESERGRGQLQVKGDQRYLTQKLGFGTMCDLTGRDRTIEIQYHCVPGAQLDRIAAIKEITTCTYLMIVHTSRLCEEDAFLPPKPSIANPIDCRLVLPSDDLRLSGSPQPNTLDGHDEGDSTAQPEHPEHPDQHGQGQGQEQVVRVPQNRASGGSPDKTGRRGSGGIVEIGGIVIGGRRLLEHGESGGGEDGAAAGQHANRRLPQPRSYIPDISNFRGGNAAANPDADPIANAKSGSQPGQNQPQHAQGQQDGDFEHAPEEELTDYRPTQDQIDNIRRRLTKVAGEHGWQFEMVEMPDGETQIRMTINDDEAEAGQEQGGGEEEDGRRDEDEKKTGDYLRL